MLWLVWRPQFGLAELKSCAHWPKQFLSQRNCHQFHRMSAANVDTAGGPADVKARIAAVGPAQFRQPLDESGELSPSPRIALVRTQEHADAAHLLRLLRPRAKRPHRCAAEE